MPTSEKKYSGYRLPLTVCVALAEAARREKRSQTQQAALILEEWLRDHHYLLDVDERTGRLVSNEALRSRNANRSD
jgi:hypothetical protein